MLIRGVFFHLLLFIIFIHLSHCWILFFILDIHSSGPYTGFPLHRFPRTPPHFALIITIPRLKIPPEETPPLFLSLLLSSLIPIELYAAFVFRVSSLLFCLVPRPSSTAPEETTASHNVSAGGSSSIDMSNTAVLPPRPHTWALILCLSIWDTL